MSESNRPKNDYFSAKVIGIEQPRWAKEPDNLNLANQRPSPDLMNQDIRQEYEKIQKMGLGDMVSARMNREGTQVSSLNLNLKTVVPDQQSFLKTAFINVESYGKRDSISKFVEKFGQDIQDGKEPIAYAAGRITTERNSNREHRVIHFAKTQEEFYADREAAFANRNQKQKPQQTKQQATPEDEMPF